TSLPERLLHQVKFTAYDAVNPSQVFFELTLPAYKLSNRSIALRYEPETVENQEIINSFGGLGATPAYLVRLRPVLTVDGQRLAVGTAGLPMGADARLAIELAGPAGTKRFVNELVVGNLTVMALVAGKPILTEPLALEQKGAERIYFDEALMYLLRWQAAERELASLLRLKLLHPAPQVVTLGGVVQVNQVLGVPHEFTWKGAFVDADLRQVELVGNNAAKKLFMDLSALQGSVLEDRVLREDLGVDSISTARLLAIANNQGIPLVTIDASNVDTLLPSLPFGTKVKQDIRDAVQQGQQVLVPDRMLTVGVWTGVGYMRTDPLTGEAGWMLSGSIAGAYTVVDRESWPGPYFMVLAHQLVSAPNYDSNAAQAIAKILASDKQKATVGASIQLKVLVVDSDQNPVDGAEVSFTVMAGGGSLAQSTVTTDVIGIATATLTLGTSTADNPIYLNEEGQPWAVQAGLNAVDAYLTTTGTHLKTPFTAIGMPDKTDARLVDLTTSTLGGRVMSWGGCPEMIVLDPHDNPVSNVAMQVFANAPFVDPGGVLFDNRPGLLIRMEDPCVAGRPSYDEAQVLCNAGNFQQLQFKSSITRATFCTVMSGSPGGHYTFDVLADVKNDESFDANLTYDIQAYFSELQSNMGDLCNMGEYLEPNCVGKAGATVRLSVNQHFIVRDQEDQGERGDFCNGATNCPVLTKMDSYSTTRQVEERTILATPVGAPDAPVQVEYLDNGESVMLLDMPTTPGNYDYDWSSTASTPVERWGGTCESCYAQPLPCFVNFYPNTSPYTPRHPLIKCHSVGFEFFGEPYVFFLDTYGYTRYDFVIGYSILAGNYQPDLAILEVFYEDGDDKVPVFYTEAVVGSDSITIGRGTYFDSSKNYFARIILNPSTYYEVRSDPVPLHFGLDLDLQIDVDNDGHVDGRDDAREDSLSTGNPPGPWVARNTDNDCNKQDANHQDVADLDEEDLSVDDDDLKEVVLSLTSPVQTENNIIELCKSNDKIR
ncbi:MAG: Ig-like domain-containing protein, partial [Deltaproteobacteria bacterium]|nr:Ig-like domain-containing protein [Deltaproteobacteria bacterium]